MATTEPSTANKVLVIVIILASKLTPRKRHSEPQEHCSMWMHFYATPQKNVHEWVTATETPFEANKVLCFCGLLSMWKRAKELSFESTWWGKFNIARPLVKFTWRHRERVKLRAAMYWGAHHQGKFNSSLIRRKRPHNHWMTMMYTTKRKQTESMSRLRKTIPGWPPPPTSLAFPYVAMPFHRMHPSSVVIVHRWHLIGSNLLAFEGHIKWWRQSFDDCLKTLTFQWTTTLSEWRENYCLCQYLLITIYRFSRSLQHLLISSQQGRVDYFC